MSVTVDQLSRKCGEAEIHKIIRDQLDMIDALLNNTNKIIGRNSISIALPVCFPEVCSGNKDIVQTMVYSAILSSLERRGFEVHIDRRVTKGGNEQMRIFVEWVNRIDMDKIEEMKKYISSRTLAP